jgi:hypothetical protein
MKEGSERKKEETKKTLGQGYFLLEVSTNRESFVLNSSGFCLFRKDYVCRITFSTEWLVKLQTKDEVEVESEVLRAR